MISGAVFYIIMLKYKDFWRVDYVLSVFNFLLVNQNFKYIFNSIKPVHTIFSVQSNKKDKGNKKCRRRFLLLVFMFTPLASKLWPFAGFCLALGHYFIHRYQQWGISPPPTDTNEKAPYLPMTPTIGPHDTKDGALFSSTDFRTCSTPNGHSLDPLKSEGQ